MASGKPPRRTKATDEPVTIDLEAEPTSKESRDEGMHPDELVADEPATAAPEGPEVVPSEGLGKEEPMLEGAANEAVGEAPAEQPTSEAAATAEPTPPVEPAPKTAPALPSLIAAGIFGGLVALAGAGSMQYAGFIPGLAPVPAPVAVPDTSALTSQLAALETKVETLSSAAPASADGDLAARLDALEESVRAVADAKPVADNSEEIDALKQELQTTREAMSLLKGEVSASTAALTQEQTLLTDRLTEAERKIEQPRNDVEMARAIAVTALKAAIDRGGPFMTELDTLAGIAADEPALAGLKDYAATGVSSRAELVRRFPDTADAILSAIRQPDGSTGIGARLLSSALSVVKVRPVGNIEGDSPEAIVARMEDKLRNGDLKGAELEWQNLPEPGKAASADFADALKVRIEVEALIGSALTTAIGGNG